MKKYLSWKLLAVLIVTLGLGFFDLPSETQNKLVPFSDGESIFESKINLGLDLQGGSQLDYKIVLPDIGELQQEELVEGVQTVIERRVNGLGLAEPNIYRAEIADETHIIVELAETGTLEQSDVNQYLGESKQLEDLTEDEKKMVSLEKAKATVGKTIQLEFKEEKTTLDPQEKDKVKASAQTALERIKSGEEYGIIAQEAEQGSPGKVSYEKSDFIFENDLPSNLKDILLTLGLGDFTKELQEIGGNYIIGADGTPVEQSSYSIIKLIETKEEVKNEREIDVSHILIAYEGSDATNASDKTEEEAFEVAKEVKEKIEGGESFATLATEFSDDNEGANDGKLDKPVTGDGTYVYDFEQAALAFKNKGDLSDIVKTQFGYHIIQANEIRTDVTEKKYKFESINYSTAPDPWQETGLSGKQFVRADVQVDQMFQPYVTIQFDEEGAKLFKEITERNLNKQVAIFVGGDLISAPTVQSVIPDGNAQITGSFTSDEASDLARDLNTGAIPAPIILTGEYTIGATLGHEALTKSLLAGGIGLLLVMVFMLFYYRLPGLVATAALIVYGTILIFLLKAELSVWSAGLISLVIFGFVTMKILNNEDSGLEKFLSFVLSLFGLIFIATLLNTGVIITLAGVAGLILSIGMAVDANILIFERLKEELSTGKSLNSAIDAAFKRAWTAIRDSNFSTLLTCAILFYFGSSIIRGFAFNLAAGIMVSMFTAITITRILIQGFLGRKIAKNVKAFGISKKARKTKKFVKHSKTYFEISGALVSVSIVLALTLGLNLGIDFTGGSLMEVQFEEKVEKSQLEQSLIEIESSMNANIAEVSTEVVVADETAISSTNPTKVELASAQILESGENGYILKTKHITPEQHDEIIDQLKDKLPKFKETRFTTIGPIIGNTLLGKAMKAIMFALLMIIVYVTFAFRRVPKSVNPWRFGACAIAALIHDVLIVTGVFILLGHFMDVEINALFITAMLTVFGYSVNDTIVVLDRLRENLLKKDGEKLADVADKSLSETLARSINTSLSTLITLVAILVLGSPSIFYFVLALTLGTLVGTYSSIFIATPLLVIWNDKSNK